MSIVANPLMGVGGRCAQLRGPSGPGGAAPTPAVPPAAPTDRITPSAPDDTFEREFVVLFDRHFPQLYRFAHRYSGDAEQAADLAQEAFVRLYQRGELPTSPHAWLASVLLNLFRNARTTRSTRHRLMSAARAERAHSEAPPSPDAVPDAPLRRRVRAALDSMAARERQLLLLHAEGLSYREIASALALHDGSVGTLLARAKRAFRTRFGEHGDGD